LPSTSGKDKDIMQKLASAKWVILLTVLINVVTVFTLVAIFPSKGSIVNATCFLRDNPADHDFISNGAYQGFLYAHDGVKLATMQITFAGTAPPSHSDRGNLNAVDFQAQALPNTPFSSFFQDMTGTGRGTANNVNRTNICSCMLSVLLSSKQAIRSIYVAEMVLPIILKNHFPNCGM
jgi:hypothetical protein